RDPRQARQPGETLRVRKRIPARIGRIEPWKAYRLFSPLPYTGVTLASTTMSVPRSDRRTASHPLVQGLFSVNADWYDLKQRVKEASDIVDVVGGYIPLQPKNGTFKGLCPFHDDHAPSFDVDPRRQRYRCWACNKIGDVFSFVMEHEHVDFREALELLA